MANAEEASTNVEGSASTMSSDQTSDVQDTAKSEKNVISNESTSDAANPTAGSFGGVPEDKAATERAAKEMAAREMAARVRAAQRDAAREEAAKVRAAQR